MAVTYGFFNSLNGDRTYNADQISDYFLKLISNGVFATPSNAMQVQAGTGLTVNVSAGWGFVKCKWINNDSSYSLQLDAADVVLNRIDRVVIRLDNSTAARSVSLAVIKGTPASTPTAPALTRSGDVYELSLAQVYIAANATSISQANITDERANTSVCGYVTGLIDQIDTTNLFAQFTAAFNEWFDEIKTEVKTTTIVTQFDSKYTTTAASEATIPINISEYNSTLDILNVYVNGMKLVPTAEYTVNGTNIVLTNALDVIGTVVEFEVLKSVDTQNAMSLVTMVSQLLGQVNDINARLNGLAFLTLTQEEYDEIEAPLDNVVYIIVEGAAE